MVDVFISYRRETGLEFGGFLYHTLTKDGYDTFFDVKSLRSGPFDEQIDRAIAECSYVLLLLSNSNDLTRCVSDPDHDWIVHELKLAIQYGKTLIPVVFKRGFRFPQDAGIPELAWLARQNICDLSGPDAAMMARETLYSFMNDSFSAIHLDAYNTGILQKDYLRWEMETLRSIYPDFDFVCEFDRLYPVVAVKGSEEVVYPFSALNDPANLEEIGKPIEADDSPVAREFKRLVGPNIHFPNLYGFTNSGIIFDESGRVEAFRAVPRTYIETVMSGHILHYELWKTYLKLGADRLATLDDLPLRKKIHGGRANQDVLFSGCGRSSLCDVCIAVLAFDEIEDDYDIAVAKRSTKVACYPGYLSIVPSGGFELYELEQMQTPIVIRRNFSMIAALYREYIEELFGDANYEAPTGDDDLRRLYRNDHIRELRKQIGKQYFFEFLGVSFDIISLRPTFSFVLRIDDPAFLYNNDIRRNQENEDLRFVSLRDFEKTVVESEEKSPLMAESAGVYRLLKENRLFEEAVR